MKAKIFTGQEIEEVKHGSEWVICAKCKDPNDLIGTNSTAWWDSSLPSSDPAIKNMGQYVHKNCLSKGQLPRK